LGLFRAKKGRDWFKIGSLDTGKDIDPVSWRNIDFDYTKLKSSMVRGELKRLVDHFEKKGLRIIFDNTMVNMIILTKLLFCSSQLG